MSSTFFGLNIGQSGLYTYQAALDTTAHNITNTETDGYTKQVLGQKAGKALPLNSTYGMAGTGVTVTGVKQLREDYYDVKFRKNNKLSGEYSNKANYLTEIENYLNEINIEGFTTSFDSMFDNLQELDKNPSSSTVRTQVINYGKSLTEFFNSISQSLKSVQEDCNFEIHNRVDQINSTAQQIASLTKQINTLEVGGGTANDLRDQRNLLVDKLSEIAGISVTEKTAGEGVGTSSYVLRIDDQTLVDNGTYNTLDVIPREEKLNQNDAEGLYDIVWANGQTFKPQGGALKALYEVRDGNNLSNLRGSITAKVNDTEVTMENTTINNVEKLNIPETGTLTIGNINYNYTGFTVTQDAATGNFKYTFKLEDKVLKDANNAESSVGESINYKGIPYYMDQMNEFIRTFSKAFNDIHKSGEDLNGNAGIDFFNASNTVSGRNYTLDNTTAYLKTGSYTTPVADSDPLYGSYYFMTADNFTVSTDIMNDSNRLVTTTDIVNGKENNDIADQFLALKSKKDMFPQGAPEGFMQTLVADVGIYANKANNLSDNQEDVLSTITNQRLSVSGVDMDEEAMNLIKYQNAYNLSAKVISTMNEIYDKLINYMGV